MIDYKEFKVARPKYLKPIGTWVNYTVAVENYSLPMSKNYVEQLCSKKKVGFKSVKIEGDRPFNLIDIGHYDVRKAEHLKNIAQMNYLYISQYLTDTQLAKLMIAIEESGTQTSWYVFFRDDLFKITDNPFNMSERFLAWLDISIKLTRSKAMKRYFINITNEDVDDRISHLSRVQQNRHTDFGETEDADDSFVIGEVKLQRIKNAS